MRVFRNYILLIFVLVLCCISANAAVTESLKINVNMDAVQVQTNTGLWRSYEAAKYVVESDSSDTHNNTKVLRIPNGSCLAAMTQTSAAIRRFTVDIKLPSTDGMVELYRYQTGYFINPQQSPVRISNGGAYVVTDFNTSKDSYECFIPDGTLQADTWYTVERILDVSVIGAHRQRAAVYDADGSLIGQSNWTICGTLTNWGSYGTYTLPTLYVQTSGFGDDNYVTIDNWKAYNLTLTPVSAEVEKLQGENKAQITFSEGIDVEYLNTDTVKLSVKNPSYTEEINYSVSYDELSNIATVEWNKLPPDEECIVTIAGTVMTEDGFELGKAIEESFVTEPDGFTAKDLKISGSDGFKKASTVLNNNSNEERSYLLVITQLDADGSMSAIKVKSGMIASGVSDLPVETEEIPFDETATYEVFLWNGWSNMNPISVTE